MFCDLQGHLKVTVIFTLQLGSPSSTEFYQFRLNRLDIFGDFVSVCEIKNLKEMQIWGTMTPSNTCVFDFFWKRVVVAVVIVLSSSVACPSNVVLFYFDEGQYHYVCIHCSKAFLTSYALKLHYRSHTQERPFCCNFPDCHKAFNTIYRFWLNYSLIVYFLTHQFYLVVCVTCDSF